MRSKTNEEALETHIETALFSHGFIKGETKDFNRDLER